MVHCNTFKNNDRNNDSWCCSFFLSFFYNYTFYFGTWLFSVMQLVMFNSSSSKTSTRSLKKRHVSSTIIIMSTCLYFLPLLIVDWKKRLVNFNNLMLFHPTIV